MHFIRTRSNGLAVRPALLQLPALTSEITGWNRALFQTPLLSSPEELSTHDPRTRPVPGQSPVLTRAACGRVPTGSYSSAGQLSGPWRVPGGIPTGSSRVFEQYTSSKEYTEVGDAAFSATCKQLTSPSEIETGDNLHVGLLALVAEEERQAELVRRKSNRGPTFESTSTVTQEVLQQ
ncbi:hypothetical protein Bbelb_394770 [Branchiostoma belcheri]|nr:hypothetical protein Bbelb_394770 [Branchiostoma belcheri]